MIRQYLLYAITFLYIVFCILCIYTQSVLLNKLFLVVTLCFGATYYIYEKLKP